MRRLASAARAITSVSQNQPSATLPSTTSAVVSRLKNLHPVSVSSTSSDSSTSHRRRYTHEQRRAVQAAGLPQTVVAFAGRTSAPRLRISFTSDGM